MKKGDVVSVFGFVGEIIDLVVYYGISISDSCCVKFTSADGEEVTNTEAWYPVEDVVKL